MDKNELQRLLRYDPDNGIFVWKPRGNLKFDNHYAGKVAGCPDAQGYITIGINGKTHKAHRLAWLMMTGSWPGIIDHINGITSDNRFVNLQEVTLSENNSKVHRKRRNNSSGYHGVRVHDYANGVVRYQARITKNKNLTKSPLFSSAEEAAKEYARLAKEIHGAYAAPIGQIHG